MSFSTSSTAEAMHQGEGDDLDFDIDVELEEGAPARAAPLGDPAIGRIAISGEFGGDEIAEVLQLAGRLKGPACCRVECPGRCVEFLFSDGTIVGARARICEGNPWDTRTEMFEHPVLDAAKEVLSWKSGRFVVLSKVELPKRPSEPPVSPQQLLLQVAVG